MYSFKPARLTGTVQTYTVQTRRLGQQALAKVRAIHHHWCQHTLHHQHHIYADMAWCTQCADASPEQHCSGNCHTLLLSFRVVKASFCPVNTSLCTHSSPADSGAFSSSNFRCRHSDNCRQEALHNLLHYSKHQQTYGILQVCAS